MDIVMNTSMTLPLLLTFMLSLSLTGCLKVSNEQKQSTQNSATGNSAVTVKQAKIWQQVSVKYYNFEGGFYGLTTEEGTQLLPMNLAKKYQLSDTVLKVKGDIIKGMVTTKQWGQPFNIIEVKLISLGKNTQSHHGAEY